MVVITVNVIDSQVNNVLKAIKESELVNVIHRHDMKTYILGKDKELYAQDEERLTFYIDDPDKIESIVNIIKESTSDKFLELTLNGEIEGEQLNKVLTGSLTEDEYKEILTDAVKVRFK